jgi:hypothetical protein
LPTNRRSRVMDTSRLGDALTGRVRKGCGFHSYTGRRNTTRLKAINVPPTNLSFVVSGVSLVLQLEYVFEGVVFGVIHFLAWNFHSLTSTGLLLSRVDYTRYR